MKMKTRYDRQDGRDLTESERARMQRQKLKTEIIIELGDEEEEQRLRSLKKVTSCLLAPLSPGDNGLARVRCSVNALESTTRECEDHSVRSRLALYLGACVCELQKPRMALNGDH